MGRNIFFGAALAGFAAILSVPAAADTKAGVDAWTRGDFAGAVKIWQAEAAKGDADAMFNLGQAYKLGRGVPQDLARATALFGQAADKGHLQAGDNFGLLLFQAGQQARALPYIRAAADRGDPRAQYLVGIAHFNGDLLPKDWVRAYALVNLAQQQGLSQAAPALAQMDQHIPMDQRQQAVALASELASQADATRARQLAAADLGSQVPSTGGVAGSAPRLPPKAPTIASAEDAVDNARRVAGNDSAATAGADYARPAVATPPPPRQAAAPPPPAPRPATAAPSTAPRPTPTASAPSAPAAGGAWRVQLGAFGVKANADAMWNKVKGRPELAGHPRLDVKAGAVTKLQAGGFATQQAAQAACTRLQSAGLSCLAVKG